MLTVRTSEYQNTKMGEALAEIERNHEAPLYVGNIGAERKKKLRIMLLNKNISIAEWARCLIDKELAKND